MEIDPCYIGGAGHSTIGFKFSDVQRAMMEAKKKLAAIPEPPDVIVMTIAVEDALRRHLKSQAEIGGSPALPPFDRLCGIPYETYPTAAEAARRAAELSCEGRRVQLCIGQE